jgi:hypothetical protein
MTMTNVIDINGSLLEMLRPRTRKATTWEKPRVRGRQPLFIPIRPRDLPLPPGFFCAAGSSGSSSFGFC